MAGTVGALTLGSGTSAVGMDTAHRLGLAMVSAEESGRSTVARVVRRRTEGHRAAWTGSTSGRGHTLVSHLR